MNILMTLLITGASMAFAVHQWRRGYHLIAIGFITLACLIAGVAIEAQPECGSHRGSPAAAAAGLT